MLYIHPDECVDCGACEPVCPVEAIFYEDDVPDQWKDFYRVNVEFFEDLGSPGGASKIGKIRKDHPIVALRCPPQQYAEMTADASRARLPAFPWDLLAPLPRRPGATRTAIVDLSIGTPVDPVPGSIRGRAGRGGGRARVPATRGTPRLRSAAAGWLARAPRRVRCRRTTVLPVIGTKEFIACAARHARPRAGRHGACSPSWRYPTYDIGARLAGATVLAADEPVRPRPVPGAPGLGELAVQPDRPGAAGRAPAQDGGLGPRTRRGGGVRRVLHLDWAGTPRRSRCCTLRCAAGRTQGVLAVHSLSKRSNLAGYRAGFVTGDPAAGRRPAGDPQARRDDHAGPGAGGDGGRARTTTPTRRSSGPGTPRGGRGCWRRCRRGGLAPSTTPRPGLYLWAATPGAGLLVGSLQLLAAEAGHPGRPRRVLRPGRANGTSGWRSPPPTSASRPRPRGCAGSAPGRRASRKRRTHLRGCGKI